MRATMQSYMTKKRLVDDGIAVAGAAWPLEGWGRLIRLGVRHDRRSPGDSAAKHERAMAAAHARVSIFQCSKLRVVVAVVVRSAPAGDDH